MGALKITWQLVPGSGQPPPSGLDSQRFDAKSPPAAPANLVN